MRKVLRFVSTIGLLAISGVAMAGPICTKEPQNKWMPEASMKEQVKQAGYTIKTFKITGSCYEIYGFDKAGKRAEIYFNPVDGSVVKKG